MKKTLLFWIPNGILFLFMAGSGVMYFMNTEYVATIFTQLGYPTYTLYFNATAKILGGLVIVFPQFPRWTKEFAYAGYLYIILLAAQATYVKMPPANTAFMVVFILLWVWAYWAFRKKA